MAKISDSMEYVLLTNHIEGDMDWDDVRKYLGHPGFPSRAADFRRELAKAIEDGTISPEEYARATGDDGAATPADVARELRSVWEYIYGSAFEGGESITEPDN